MDDGPYYASSGDDGITFSDPIPIVDAASQKPGLKFSGEDLAVGSDGRVHVAMANNAWKLKLPQDAACPMTYFAIHQTAAGYVAAWPTKGQVSFARIDKDGTVKPPGEIRTAGITGMRNGLVALSASDGVTLIAWKNKNALGWQLYDADAQPMGKPGSADSPGNGAAGVVLQDGRFVLFP